MTNGVTLYGIRGPVKFLKEEFFEPDEVSARPSGDSRMGMNLFYTTQVLFDREGNIIEKKTIGFQGEEIITTYNYDGHGRLIEEAWHNPTIPLRYKVQYRPDGQILKMDTYGHDKLLIETRHYEYDSNGYCVREEFYDIEGELTGICYLKWFARGLIQEVNHCDADGNVKDTSRSHYDEENNEVEREFWTSDPDSFTRSVNKYDKNHKETEVIHYDENDGVLSRFSYEYQLDELGNWTEKREMKDGFLNRIVRRELGYHK